MAEYGMFKTALRGFRKEDVLAYVDELLAERSRMEAEWQGEIDNLKAQLAEAQVQQQAVLENERLAAQVEDLTGQIEVLKSQVAEVTAQFEQEKSASEAATLRDAERSEQLEQSHQAIASLWEEKAELQKQLDESRENIVRLRSLGEEFCRRVTEMLPEEAAQAEATVSVQAEPVEEPKPEIEKPLTTEPLVIDTPRPADKPMERWLF